MALNGVFYGTTSNQFIKPKILWSAVQSQEGNYSDVTATLFYSRTNKGYTTESTWYGSITIEGQSLSENRFLSITYDSNTQAISNTVRVYHDSYGTKRVTISAEGYCSGTSLTETTISQTVELDTIARASTIGASDGFIGSAVTISVQQKSLAYTHSIAWSFGALTGYIGANWENAQEEAKLSDTSISFTLPEAFYGQIPDSPTGVCTLTCRTWSADTQIGQAQTCTFLVTARESLCAPQITGTILDQNAATTALTGDPSILVRGMSEAYCMAQAQAKKEARLSAIRINGITAEDAEATFPAFEGTQVVFYAADTRGYFNTYTLPVELIPYVKLTAVVSCQRTDPTSGNAALVVEGQYFSGSFGAEENALQVTCSVNGGDPVVISPEITENGYKGQTVLSGLDYTCSHRIEVTVSDKLSGITRTVSVGKGIPVFDWGEQDFVFHVPVSAPSINGVSDLGLAAYPVGAVYLSVSPTSPQTLFGGTWERLKDVFLLAAGDIFTAGSTGGERTHTLTREELPAQSLELLVDGTGLADITTTFAAGSNRSGLGWDHTDGRMITTEPMGNGQAHNNMPPYLAVYIWKRVA